MAERIVIALGLIIMAGLAALILAAAVAVWHIVLTEYLHVERR
jgi:hypothetical protein